LHCPDSEIIVSSPASETAGKETTMAILMVQHTNKTIDAADVGELSDADRRSMRLAQDRNPMIRLYEVVPSTLRERQSWGRGMHGAGQAFREAAAR
jgi:hypothetical protein